MVNAWKTTPIKWYPIPVLLGAIVLVAVKARRDWIKDRNESRGKVVDEEGKIVTMHGPWTVSVLGGLQEGSIVIDCMSLRSAGIRTGGSTSERHLESMGLGQ
jgi:hypothetical protein